MIFLSFYSFIFITFLSFANILFVCVEFFKVMCEFLPNHFLYFTNSYLKKYYLLLSLSNESNYVAYFKAFKRIHIKINHKIKFILLLTIASHIKTKKSLLIFSLSLCSKNFIFVSYLWKKIIVSNSNSK